MSFASFVENQMWLCPYPVRLAGTAFEARMTVIRLSTGELVLHSPCDITAVIGQEISTLGRVAHIVAPGNFHHLHVASAQTAFPTARTWICPGVEKRSADLKYDSILGDAAPAEWSDDLDQTLVHGSRIMREVAMFHKASRTLILVDLIENFTDRTPHIGGALKFWFKNVLGMWNNPRPAPEYSFGWGNRQAAADSLRRILSWDFQQIVVSHGDLITHHARDVAVKAWSKVLDYAQGRAL